MSGRAKRKVRPQRLFFVILFAVGFLVAIYPVISNFYYRQVQQQEAMQFKSERAALSPEEVERRMALAEAYNATLDPSRMADPYTDLEKRGVAQYARMLELHEMIGYVEIPKIAVNLPVHAGTSVAVLDQGAGHLEGTSLPIGGASTHAVITAHRGLAKTRMFRDLDQLVVGDVFYFHNIAGTLAYEVDQILTVEPSDFDPVLVQEGEDLMTLLTCTPYMVNSHRLLVRGHRVEYVDPIEEQALRAPEGLDYAAYLPFVLIAVLVLAVVALVQYRDVRALVRRRDAEWVDSDDEAM